MTFQILEPAALVGVYDTETTGFPLFKQPSNHVGQPHLVDLCIQLYSFEGEFVDEMEAMVRPYDWTIPKSASDVHGITTEMAIINGIDEREAVSKFGHMHKRASLRVAHNCAFDDRIMRIAIKRYFGDAAADRFKLTPTYCTATNSKPIIKLPPTEKMTKTSFKNSFKTPNLAEAFKFFTGRDFEGAHRAKADTVGCAEVYFALQKMIAGGVK